MAGDRAVAVNPLGGHAPLIGPRQTASSGRWRKRLGTDCAKVAEALRDLRGRAHLDPDLPGATGKAGKQSPAGREQLDAVRPSGGFITRRAVSPLAAL